MIDSNITTIFMMDNKLIIGEALMIYVCVFVKYFTVKRKPIDFSFLAKRPISKLQNSLSFLSSLLLLYKELLQLMEETSEVSIQKHIMYLL